MLGLAALAACATPRAEVATTQPGIAPERTIPWPVTPPPEFRRAIANGTRTERGAPGVRYWVQWADYTLSARVDPAAKRLEGEGRVVYHNRSPDELDRIELQLIQNLHAPEVVRNEEVEVTGGIQLSSVVLGGGEIHALSPGDTSRPGYVVDGTRLTVLPGAPVPAGGSVTLELAWSFTIPQQGAGARMGWNGDDLVYLAYWYPQMAVYDDVVGWQVDPFRGNAEFYADHGSYDLTIQAPSGWLVRSTGELVNPEATLSASARERLALAAAIDSVVRVSSAGEDATVGGSAMLSWHFAADSVRDVAFVLARSPNWDATRTPVGDRDGDGTTDYARIESVWRESAPRWHATARYAQHSIRHHSDFTATPYPWPHMTAVEGGGIINGGMEYPMMTLIGDYNARGDSALYNVTAHELAHMWLPMTASNDERRYAWMDEGSTTFHENQARKDFFPGLDHDLGDQNDYLATARDEEEGEIMRWSDFHTSGNAYGTASYPKPATMLAALRAMLGEEVFFRAWHAFFDRWSFRHPYPWDMWNTFEDVSGQDLDWFWRAWYYETWTMDQAITAVRRVDGEWTVVVEDRGLAPMPVRLRVAFAGGGEERLEVGPDAWLAGRRSMEVLVTRGDETVVGVEIDPDRDYPDIDRSNNVWPR